MREILFRGKRLDNGEWVEGCLIIDGVSGQRFIKPVGDSANERDLIGEEGVLHFLAFEVDTETVGQYIGLTDKSCIKIFEGDILYDEECEEICVIGYDHKEAGFVLEYKRDLTNLEYINDCIRVGNVHDNPELLERKG